MTLLARDEIDVIETQLSYHLNAGVDFVIAVRTTIRTTEPRRCSSRTSARNTYA